MFALLRFFCVKPAVLLAGIAALLLTAVTHAAHPDPNVAALDRILAAVEDDQETVAVGDMVFEVSLMRAWRAHLAARGQSPPGAQAAFAGGVNLWPGGVVVYAFDASVSLAHQRSFLDAANDWAAWANLQFILRTTQTNYIIVKDVLGLSGGQSFVGVKIPGPQELLIGSGSWNRATLCHEIGHALGLIHEHQRSDRDNFVTIIFANVAGGMTDGNFMLLPDSQNRGAYDFFSVMHYGRNTLSANPPADTIVPKPDFAHLIDRMGAPFDRALSAADRAGVAAMYGPPSIPPGPIVTNTNDSGPGSLRTAIYYAIDHPGTTITFQIPASDPGFAGGVFTTRVTDAMTTLGVNTIIDGTTQAAFGGDTNPSGPKLLLDGSLAVDTFPQGITLAESGCTVRGLAINAFRGSGVHLRGPGATGNVVSGCYIGTNAAGTAAVENAIVGVLFDTGANGNLIGGTTAAARNVISGNHFQGIAIRDAGTNQNRIEGNYIGLNAAGTAPLANGFGGVDIFGGAMGNRVGGSLAGAGNVISGNLPQGVAISGAGTSGNVVAGNLIGLNAAGNAAVGNGFGDPGTQDRFSGVGIFEGATANIIGGTAAGEGNVIGGNAAQGVAIADVGTNNNRVEGNLVGLNAAGTAAIANGGGHPDPARKFAAVEIFREARANTIGGTAAGARNVVSGNAGYGIVVVSPGTNGNFIQGNYVGLTPSGTAALGNGSGGIGLFGGAQGNFVGGLVAGARNVIGGNSDGIVITNAGTNGNFVQGNYVGLRADGTGPVPNTQTGVGLFSGAQFNLVGGLAPGAGNVISGNGGAGIFISGVSNGVRAANNLVQGNFIGVNPAGTAALANQNAGVAIFGGAQNNTIGGAAPAARNIISGNAGDGVVIGNDATNGNVIAGNTIGWNAAGTGAIGNGSSGVVIFGNLEGNAVGGTTPGSANMIAGNAQYGVALFGFNAVTRRNPVLGNSIFENGFTGLAIFNGANNSQSAPNLATATLGPVGNPDGTNVVGSLTSAASTDFRVEFFASPVADDSGFGEGRFFVGAMSVTTNGAGTANFTANLAAAVPAGYVVAATATDPVGNTSSFSNSRLVNVTDSDGDGLPNGYETANGLLVNTNDAALDADGDGASNLAEFRAGTDPRNPSSVLRLPGIAFAGANVVINLPTFLGRTYRVEYADDLALPNHWRLFADQLPGTGASLPLTDAGAASRPQRFYRAAVVP